MFKNKALIPIFIVVFVDLLGFTIILPILPYYASSYGASPTVIGLLVASYSVCQFFASPLLGSLSDKFGRRPVLIASQLGSMLGFIVLGIANTLILLFVARIIDGLSGGNLTVAQAYIADVTEPKDRAAALGIIGIAFGLGFTMGPFIGGELTQYGYWAPAFLAAFFSLSSTMLTVFYLKEPAHHAERKDAKRGLSYYAGLKRFFNDPKMVNLFLSFVAFSFPFALYVTMFSLFAKIEYQFTPKDVGRFLAFIGVLGIIWQGFVIRILVRKLGEVVLLRTAFVALVLGLIGIALARGWGQLLGVAVIFSFGSSMCRPTISSLITQTAPADQRGSALGVTSSLDSASRSAAPIIGGLIIGGLHPNYLGYIGAAIAVFGIYFAFKIRENPHELDSVIG